MTNVAVNNLAQHFFQEIVKNLTLVIIFLATAYS